MALIGLVSKDYAKGIVIVKTEGLDALILANSGDPKDVNDATENLDGKPWGVKVSGLSRDNAQAYQDSGSDALVFDIEGTSASALVNDELARFLCVEANMEDKDLRAVSSLPIDGFLMSLTQGNDGLTLGDLALVGSVSRRSDKYILLEVQKPIEGKDLEALRDIGVHGLLVDVDAMGLDNLKSLKTSLMEMMVGMAKFSSLGASGSSFELSKDTLSVGNPLRTIDSILRVKSWARCSLSNR